ncbi:MAG: BatA and WFA domain-containing protein [Anaerolineae bacterium]
MNFLTPLAFAGALLAIPIILLYMLRLRRREVTISSTFLWQQVLRDQEANTPWQRLRRNLLLFLQLLILALIVFALARPFIVVPAVSAGQITVLLDASASMNATDEDGSRFDAAKREATAIVDTMSAGDRMTVIRVGDVPEVLASSTDNRTQLREAIAEAQPGLSEGDWEAALNLAAAGSTTTDDFTIVMVSDGGLPENTGLPGISGEVRYVPVGSSGENVAITALATRARGGETPELYAQITNYGETEARVVFTLFVDGERFAAQNETIPAGADRAVISRSLPEGFTTLQATLTQSVNAAAPDHLAVDDVAYAVSGDGGARRVLVVTEGNLFIEQVLRSLPGLDVVRSDNPNALPENFDVYLFDALVPTTLPEGDLFFINPRASTALFTVGAESENTANPALVNRSDPRLNFVEVNQLNLLRFRQVGSVDWAEALITVEGGPILLAGENDGRQVAVMPFDVRDSDLPLQITWPVLMANLMEWFTPRAVITVTDSLSVGDSLSIRPPFEADSVRITTPEGEARVFPVERETVIFAGANTPGIYTLELLAGENVLSAQPFAVNLFSGLESDIAPVSQENLTLDGTVLTLETENELGQREFWPFIALLALLFLLIEWVVYHRRLRVPTVFRPIATRRPAPN